MSKPAKLKFSLRSIDLTKTEEPNGSIKLKPKTKKSLLLLGVIIMIVGISVSYFSGPATDSPVWFDQTFQVAQYEYYYISGEFSSPDTVLHIDFETTQTQGALDFWVMDEANFENFTSDRQFDYYSLPSAAHISGRELDWGPPIGSKIYFVWDNANSGMTLSVQAVIKQKSSLESSDPLIMLIIEIIGLTIFLFGLSLIAIGFRPPTKASSRGTINLGYVLAVLGGLLGIVLGVYLRKKENPEDRLHGIFILAIGAVALALYVLLLFI